MLRQKKIYCSEEVGVLYEYVRYAWFWEVKSREKPQHFVLESTTCLHPFTHIFSTLFLITSDVTNTRLGIFFPIKKQ